MTLFMTPRMPAASGSSILPLSARVIWIVTSGKSVWRVEAGTFLKTFRKIAGIPVPAASFAPSSFFPSTASRAMRLSLSGSDSAAVFTYLS
ncbi:MAG: hypothetical protein BWY99_01777 [Synergistetes bacterium ADurb.BinA166]|nr:MAG: hypothetical protein BWY99_01777 [Synergistetes bacterium ADurb.BinA166]